MAACPARWEALLSGLVRHVRSTLPACDIVGHAQSAAIASVDSDRYPGTAGEPYDNDWHKTATE